MFKKNKMLLNRNTTVIGENSKQTDDWNRHIIKDNRYKTGCYWHTNLFFFFIRLFAFFCDFLQVLINMQHVDIMKKKT